MVDGMIIRVTCKVKDLQVAIDKAWTQARGPLQRNWRNHPPIK